MPGTSRRGCPSRGGDEAVGRNVDQSAFVDDLEPLRDLAMRLTDEGRAHTRRASVHKARVDVTATARLWSSLHVWTFARPGAGAVLDEPHARRMALRREGRGDLCLGANGMFISSPDAQPRPVDRPPPLTDD